MIRRAFKSRIALSMLPLGVVLTLGSAIGAVAVLALAIDALWRWPADAGWWIGWCVVALVAAMFNTRKGIETMATFDWHVAILPVTLSVAIVATWPGFWL